MEDIGAVTINSETNDTNRLWFYTVTTRDNISTSLSTVVGLVWMYFIMSIFYYSIYLQ